MNEKTELHDEKEEPEHEIIVVSHSVGYLLVFLAFLGLTIDKIHTTCIGWCINCYIVICTVSLLFCIKNIINILY